MRNAMTAPQQPNLTPAAALHRAWRGCLLAVLLFSTLVNLLMLTGPMFMLQVYDRVIASQSEATLIALFGLTAFLYAMMVLLDHARARLVARVGARMAALMEGQLFHAAQRQQIRRPGDPTGRAALQDLEMLQRWLASPVFLAIFDAPWTPFFLLLIWWFHPVLGMLAIAGAGVLVGLAVLNQFLVRRRNAAASEAAQAAERLGDRFQSEAPVMAALGMQAHGFARWQALRGRARAEALAGSDRASFFAAATKGMRLFLQSAMLAAGAWLVLRGELGPGAMIAASIILGRALAPVEQAVGQWGSLQAVRTGWDRLKTLLAEPSEPGNRLALPKPGGDVTLRDLVVVPPGQMRAVLRDLSLSIPEGQMLGVIGPSGAGKSSLARVMVGAWPVLSGAVRLGGLSMTAFPPEMLGRWLGYLPQRVTLFDGTIAENIARLDPAPQPEAVLAAARAAGAHELIMNLPDGYDTVVQTPDAGLSGGQLQRIGLARALYGDPVLVVLDEPDANLDKAGLAALTSTLRALRARGVTTLLIAHRAASIAECDAVLALDGGRITAYGPRDRVLDACPGNTSAAATGAEPPHRAGLAGQPQQGARSRDGVLAP